MTPPPTFPVYTWWYPYIEHSDSVLGDDGTSGDFGFAHMPEVYAYSDLVYLYGHHTGGGWANSYAWWWQFWVEDPFDRGWNWYSGFDTRCQPMVWDQNYYPSTHFHWAEYYYPLTMVELRVLGGGDCAGAPAAPQVLLQSLAPYWP